MNQVMDSMWIDGAEWQRRYAARLMTAGGMNERAAIAAARDLYESTDDPSDLLSPETAADMEMLDWEDDQ
jgi:hypothetical protein